MPMDGSVVWFTQSRFHSFCQHSYTRQVLIGHSNPSDSSFPSGSRSISASWFAKLPRTADHFCTINTCKSENLTIADDIRFPIVFHNPKRPCMPSLRAFDVGIPSLLRKQVIICVCSARTTVVSLSSCLCASKLIDYFRLF